MLDVKFRLSNIQSHENTAFSLGPGLNFILADDNNVGKSTIFKAIMMMAKMPRVADGELHELLRGGASTGYVSMEFADRRVTFWLNRDGERVRAFFEIVEAGVSTRSATCPQLVLDALDIVLGSDGLPINFNDADSVQLIVQDTAKNDEVLSKVLIDVDVDIIKQNALNLDKQVQQDYRLVDARYLDTQNLLSTLSYNDVVDTFFEEQELLYALVRVGDCLMQGCALENVTGTLPALDPSVDVACSVADSLYVPDVVAVTVPEGFEQFLCATKVLTVLCAISVETLDDKYLSDSTVKLANLARSVSVVDCLRKAEISSSFCASNTADMQSLKVEQQQLLSFMQENFEIVRCPVKGDVYFGDEECVPVGD